MQDCEPRDLAGRGRLGDPPDEAGPDPDVSAEHRARRRWSAERKAQIVRESFWPGNRVSDVAQRNGLSRKQLSGWRSLARKGKLAVPCIVSRRNSSFSLTSNLLVDLVNLCVQLIPRARAGVHGTLRIMLVFRLA